VRDKLSRFHKKSLKHQLASLKASSQTASLKSLKEVIWRTAAQSRLAKQLQ
jgi:hypothetical protein